MSDLPQVRVHHCQRHGQDGVLRVPQRYGRCPRPHRGHWVAGDLRRFGGFAVEMEDDAANDAHHDDDEDNDDVIAYDAARAKGCRSKPRATHTHIHYTTLTHTHVRPILSILPSIYRYCQKPDDLRLRLFVRSEETHSKRPSAGRAGGCM